MADNLTVDNNTLTDYVPATDEVTHSGDTAHVQVVRPALVTGAEGAKTIVDLSSGNGASGTGVLRVTIANDSTGNIATVGTLTGGGIAHDAADSGNPVKVGAKAITSLKTTTLVTSGDRADNQADLDGALLMRTQHPLGDSLSERIADTSGTSTVFTNFGAVASTRNYVMGISAFNSSAGACYLDIRDGAAGAVLYTLYLPAGGGCVIPSGSTPLFRSSANTALAYDVSGAITTVYINMCGFQSKA